MSMSIGKSRYVGYNGAYGWLLPGHRYRVMRRRSGGEWFVQERGCYKGGCDGQWLSHDGGFATLREAVGYCEPRP